MWGILLLVAFIGALIWAVRFGNDLGRDIARYQIGKRDQLDRIERRIAALEKKPRT